MSNAAPIQLIRSEIAKGVVGMQDVIEQILITVLCRSHSLLEGFAGVGKWLAVQAVAKALGLDARMLRASEDLTVQELISIGALENSQPVTDAGYLPLFANLLFVDRLDRLPPKVANVLQQAMQERVAGPAQQRLADPFVLLGGRQPGGIPSERTVTHDDRYLFKIAVTYPAYDEEYAAAGNAMDLKRIQPVVSADELRQLADRVSKIDAAPSAIHYAVRLVRATRVHEGENLDFIYEWVERGAGPRAARGLVSAAKARAVLHGRSAVSHEDLKAITLPTLRHRILTNQNAAANGITVDRVIQRLLEDVPPRIEGDTRPPRSGESFNFHNWVPIDS